MYNYVTCLADYLTAMVNNCVPWRQLSSCSVTRPFLSLRRVWLAILSLSLMIQNDSRVLLFLLIGTEWDGTFRCCSIPFCASNITPYKSLWVNHKGTVSHIRSTVTEITLPKLWFSGLWLCHRPKSNSWSTLLALLHIYASLNKTTGNDIWYDPNSTHTVKWWEKVTHKLHTLNYTDNLPNSSKRSPLRCTCRFLW